MRLNLTWVQAISIPSRTSLSMARRVRGATNLSVFATGVCCGTPNVKVVDVYDGDTLSVVANIENRLVKLRCRVAGVDTPEMKPPKDLANRKQVKQNAKIARDFVVAQTTNVSVPKNLSRLKLREHLKLNTLVLPCTFLGSDKYGRQLVSFNTNACSLADELIERGYAYAYNGGTKRKAQMRT